VSAELPRVLFLTTDVPRDGETGGQIASWRVLQAYATFARVDVLALTPPGATVPPELSELAGQLATVPIQAFHYRRARLRLLSTLARSWMGGAPYRVAKFDRAEVRTILREWTARTRYDLVHCERLATTPYADCVPSTPFVFYDYEVESHDLATMAEANSNPLARAVLGREARRTRAAELAVIGRAGHVFAVSEEDAQLLAGGDPGRSQKVAVCPVPMPDARPISRRGPDAFTALALGPLHAGGRLDGLRWFLSAVWPSARSQHPEARLLVVGAGAPADVRARDGQDGIEVRGFVEDLDGVLAETDVCVMPLLSGGGIRIKVLELLPRGVPCLGSRVAVRGFAGVAGVYEANLPQEWLQALGSLAGAPAAARRTALKGADQLRPRFSLRATARELEDGFAQATAAAAAITARP
jgi:glycosyltransferase involved in cell wall biosynthesis